MKRVPVLLIFSCALLAAPRAHGQVHTARGAAEPASAQDSADVRAIGAALDAWHRAAATADAETFFGFMDGSCVYYGTDASERWSTAAFEEFARPYFARGKAWSFAPRDRTVRLLGCGLAVFDESLDTWMGVCRGTGTLRKTDEGWRLLSYHLAMTIPNDRVRDVLTLLGGNGKKP